MKESCTRFMVGVIMALGLMCYGKPAQAGTLNVCKSSCTYSTIQSAIDDASPGDTVLVDDGTYVENIDFSGKAITLQSVNGATSTTIDGNANGSVVVFENSEVASSVLDGFTITNGSGNSIEHEGNYYIVGGGIYCINNSSPTINNCIIKGNTANHDGGGIECFYYSSPALTNCTISGNWAGEYGGGIECFYYSSPTFINCTISGNSTGGEGGGIDSDYNSSPTVINSVLWGDTAGGSPNEIYLFSSSSITITYSDINPSYINGDGIPSLSDNINANPLFVGNGDYHLTFGSPCIDAGNSSGAPADDIDGDSRPQGAGYDMGADEYKADGDVNEDGNITPQDALMVFQQYLGLIQLDESELAHCDVNNDGSITPADALCIFQKYLGLSSCLD